jgi:lysozyme
MRAVPEICLDFLKGAEACKLSAYRDSGGVWTIGVGHTGPEVVSGLSISQTQADAYLFTDATKAATRLSLVVKDAVLQGLSEHQYAALVSFAFNLGANASWTVWAMLNAGKLDAVPVQMMRFDKARVNGQLVEIPGLFNRRAAEVSLWKTADVGASIAVAQAAPVAPPASADTSAMATPPTPMNPKGAGSSKTFITSLLAAAAGMATAAQQGLAGAKGAIAPYVADSTLLSALNQHLAVAGAVLSLATVTFAYLKTRNTQ